MSGRPGTGAVPEGRAAGVAYATDLATTFHAFYRDARVIDEAEVERSRARLALAAEPALCIAVSKERTLAVAERLGLHGLQVALLDELQHRHEVDDHLGARRRALDQATEGGAALDLQPIHEARDAVAQAHRVAAHLADRLLLGDALHDLADHVHERGERDGLEAGGQRQVTHLREHGRRSGRGVRGDAVHRHGPARRRCQHNVGGRRLAEPCQRAQHRQRLFRIPRRIVVGPQFLARHRRTQAQRHQHDRRRSDRKDLLNGIPRSSRLVARDGPVGAKERIEQRGLTDIRAADDGDLQSNVGLLTQFATKRQRMQIS